MSRGVNLSVHKNVKQKNNFELKISTWEGVDQQLRELKLRTGVRNTRAISSREHRIALRAREPVNISLGLVCKFRVL
jgi:hypothetical protein